MKWLGLYTVLLTAGLALGNEHRSAAVGTQPEGHHGGGAAAHAKGGGGHGDDSDVPGYILHHVADSSEYEFELPGPLHVAAGHTNPKVDLTHAFAFLRIPLKDGACPSDPHEDASLSAGCLDLVPTKHVLMMWLAAVLLMVSVLAGSNRNKAKLVPRGTSANLFEMLVLFVRDEIAIKNIGKEDGHRYTPYLLTAFFFILFMNLLGLVPWMATATGNLAVTAALALCTFVVTQAASIRAAGLGGYLKHLTGGVHWGLWPIMIPVEFLGLFTKPFALTVRLFANMLAGHIVIFFLLGLIFILNHPAVAVVSVPFAMAIYLLELFVAFVQAYIFTMLSALFIGMGVAMGHHHDDHGHSEGGHSHDHGVAHTLGS
jgi:F-type H+-transporting ATPase subunit a